MTMFDCMIDLQALQTESRYRGIGRSLSEIIDHLIPNINDIRWHFILNANFIKEAGEIISKYQKYKNIYFHIIQFLPESSPFYEKNITNNKISSQIFSLYVNYIKPDIIFIPNLFEGFIDDAVLSLENIESSKIIILIHDFIPALNPASYFDTRPINYKNFYYNRLNFTKNADHIFVISKSVLNEVNQILPHYNKAITNISSGVSDKFCKLERHDDKDIKTKLELNQFILYAGGFDERKNIKILIESYSKYLQEINLDIKLVLSGPISSFDREQIRKWTKTFDIKNENIIITGYVSDEDLISLYNHATMFIFPSWHEGFGLPALEAIRCGTLVLAANATSLPEVIGTPETLFDPFDSDAIKSLMIRYTKNIEEKNSLIEKQYLHSQKFSWKETASKIEEQLRTISATSSRSKNLKWSEMLKDMDQNDDQFFARIKQEVPKILTSEFKIFLSNILSNNRKFAENILRTIKHYKIEEALIEGPYDTNYSLAIVNRNIALDFKKKYKKVNINSADGPGNYKPAEQIFSNYPELKTMQISDVGQIFCGDLHSRNMYPPRCNEMVSFINSYHCYAWEETGFPLEYVKEFNNYLQLITVTSNHVKNLLMNNGVNVPIYVTGNGIDHFPKNHSNSSHHHDRTYNFLHISSCFPRKGIDLLIKAYFEEFTENDDVSLTIKTFTNPHNEINKLIEDAKANTNKQLNVNVIFDDVDKAELSMIYAQCDCFVGPSRAEGFGLPFAEALSFGKDVITTNWSGALDFCNDENSYLIDFDFAFSSSHLNIPSSIWAEPKLDDLKEKMRLAYKNRSQKLSKKNNSNDTLVLDSKFSWQNVTQKHFTIFDNLNLEELRKIPKIGMISTFFKRCGIATYAEHLLTHMGIQCKIYADYQSYPFCNEFIDTELCWNEGSDDLNFLLEKIKEDQLNIVVIQFNYGFFNFKIFNDFLRKLFDLNIQVIIELHATKDPLTNQSKKLSVLEDNLRKCTRLIVHDLSDLNRLKSLSLIDNVVLIPHGILSLPHKNRKYENIKRFKLASFGFFLPNKGLLELIEAMKILKDRDFDFSLLMLNSEYPNEISKEIIALAREKIRQYNLSKYIEVDTAFHTDAHILEKLSDCHTVVYPYQESNESASGAIRYGIASQSIVVASPLEIFENVSPVVHKLKGLDPHAIAETLIELKSKIVTNSSDFQSLVERQRQWVDHFSFENIGYIYKNMILSLFKNRLT